MKVLPFVVVASWSPLFAPAVIPTPESASVTSWKSTSNKRCTNQLGWLLRNCPRQIGNYLFSAVHYLEQWHSGEFKIIIGILIPFDIFGFSKISVHFRKEDNIFKVNLHKHYLSFEICFCLERLVCSQPRPKERLRR